MLLIHSVLSPAGLCIVHHVNGYRCALVIMNERENMDFQTGHVIFLTNDYIRLNIAHAIQIFGEQVVLSLVNSIPSASTASNSPLSSL